ncbi:carboxylate/amino acid/amine transporter [Andreprevotia lacus DSM 23236]|jgi:carboxylate/amino acid/amine transporter|uniref:Carboxylate/amino acid/amine transporter n=1 Tax=Andreprevotia lacus DSM 23236 TaxID=1121001 RepID=A0A1W1XQS6_9NEIS|nr:carboxylate/amino acid/amine transporter [Andreprevotia lacus]SMC26340.1 carboxylate/amino acid/amine transporter [Andreprevotia lacus DSM 23236]
MRYLVIVTLIWALSFSLIGEYLAGRVDSDFAVLTRVLIAGAVFLPFTRWRGLPWQRIAGTMAAGALQFGITYLLLYRAFHHLTVAEVLLFTIFTPIFITLLDDAFARRFNALASVAALLAIAGSLVIRYNGIAGDFLNGFLLLQLANFSFALGQVGYKHLVQRYPTAQPATASFGWFFAGALLIALPSFLLFGNPAKLPATTLQWSVLAYMGLASSALGFYWWNKGATLLDAGTLGAMNNMHIPTGIALNMLIWQHHADVPRLLLGGGLMLLAVWLNQRWQRQHKGR